MQPFHEFEAPLGGFRGLALIHSIAMSAGIVQHKHVLDVLCGEGAVEVDGVLVHDDRVIDGRYQEGGWHIGRNLQLHGVLILLFFGVMAGEQVAARPLVGDAVLHGDHRVDWHHKVGTVAILAHEAEGSQEAGVVIDAGHGHEVAASGKAHHSDFVGVEVPAFGVDAQELDGVLQILYHGWMMVAFVARTIAQYVGVDTLRVEPFGYAKTFCFNAHQMAVAAARANNHGYACVDGVGRMIAIHLGGPYTFTDVMPPEVNLLLLGIQESYAAEQQNNKKQFFHYKICLISSAESWVYFKSVGIPS